MWIEHSVDKTSSCRQATATLAPAKRKLECLTDNKNWVTSLLHNDEVTRPQLRTKSIYIQILFTIYPALLSYCQRVVLHKGTCLTIQHIALKITRLTKKQINQRKEHYEHSKTLDVGPTHDRGSCFLHRAYPMIIQSRRACP
jgi:hypothetical protein